MAEKQAIYVKLRDTSGAYWNPTLGINLSRETPAKVTDIPTAKSLIKKGVLQEVSEEEYQSYFKKNEIRLNKEKEAGEDKQKVLLEKYDASIGLAKKYAEQGYYEDALRQAYVADHVLPEKEEQTREVVKEIEKSYEKYLEAKKQKEADDIKKLINACIDSEVITQAGSWYKFQGETLGNGLNDTVEVLRGDQKTYDAVVEALEEARKEEENEEE